MRNAKQQERLITNILKKPFRVPIPGYEGRCAAPRHAATAFYLRASTLIAHFSGTSSGRIGLGVRKPAVRGPLHDPEADGAVVLYTPPPLSAQDATNPEIKYVRRAPAGVRLA